MEEKEKSLGERVTAGVEEIVEELEKVSEGSEEIVATMLGRNDKFTVVRDYLAFR